jgi:hypothetical protein
MGKYLGGHTYYFYKRNILDLKKGYKSLTEYFEAMFDYVFPVDFQMQQHDLFDTCEQDNQTVLDFLQQLHKIADTVGDFKEKDVVMAF